MDGADCHWLGVGDEVCGRAFEKASSPCPELTDACRVETGGINYAILVGCCGDMDAP